MPAEIFTLEKIIKPTFKKAGDDDFFKKIQGEVQAGVLSNKRIQNQIVFKSLLLLIIYLIFYSCILLFGNNIYLLFAFYVFTGLSMILVFLNAFHDAAHGTIFKKKIYNEALTYVLELYGCNSFIWKKRHLLLHHPYPNVQQWDVDVKQSELVRIFPQSKWFSFHKYQHIYMWLLYLFYTLNWLLIRDFKDFFGNEDNYVKRITQIPMVEYLKLFAAKLLNLFLMIGLPILVLDQHWYTIIAAFLVMHLAASAFGVTALLSTHADEDADFPLVGENGQINNTWAEYQVAATNDFCTKAGWQTSCSAGSTTMWRITCFRPWRILISEYYAGYQKNCTGTSFGIPIIPFAPGHLFAFHVAEKERRYRKPVCHC
jgi:linoleoyl-CoA desaturase